MESSTDFLRFKKVPRDYSKDPKKALVRGKLRLTFSNRIEVSFIVS